MGGGSQTPRYLERVIVSDFGCLKHVDVALTPLHAFIGPNDSGKSTLLRGLHSALELARGVAPSIARGVSDGTTLDLHIAANVRVTFSFRGNRWHITLRTARGQQEWPWDGQAAVRLSTTLNAMALPVEIPGGARLLRLDTDALKQPSPLIPESNLDQFFVNRGRGLPAVLDLILGRGDESYSEISEKIRHLFPVVRRVGLRAVSSGAKQVEIELNDGTVVGADSISDGLLTYLAYAAIGYLKPVSMLLVEEPENGLHPARIAEVVRTLRHVSQTRMQVVIATHSPLVVNELQPEEVTVVTRTLKAGTRLTRIHDTPDFEARSRVYALGELWLSYADGNLETPLLDADHEDK